MEIQQGDWKRAKKERKKAKDIVNLTRTQNQILELESTSD